MTVPITSGRRTYRWRYGRYNESSELPIISSRVMVAMMTMTHHRYLLSWIWRSIAVLSILFTLDPTLRSSHLLNRPQAVHCPAVSASLPEFDLFSYDVSVCFRKVCANAERLRMLYCSSGCCSRCGRSMRKCVCVCIFTAPWNVFYEPYEHVNEARQEDFEVTFDSLHRNSSFDRFDEAEVQLLFGWIAVRFVRNVVPIQVFHFQWIDVIMRWNVLNTLASTQHTYRFSLFREIVDGKWLSGVCK